MREQAAIQAALNLVARPAQARRVTDQPLPSGLTFLLEVAAGDRDALAEARRVTERSDAELRQAAGFFIEQCLLGQAVNNSYRVLGTHSEDAQETLRRHMVLLMRWLHPDIAERNRDTGEVDRSVFAHRVSAAWDDVKTRDRRSAYDRRNARQGAFGATGRVGEAAIKLGSSRRPTGGKRDHKASGIRQKRSAPRPRSRAMRREPLLIRIARALWRRG